MKLLFLCAAAAFASQDVTPPVISLTMPELATGVRHSSLNRTVLDAKSVKGNRNKAAYRSVTCEVGTSAADKEDCPKPTCKAYDHHDGALTCEPTYILVNNDGVELTGSNVEADIKRGLRSEWLLKYDATDLSGNAAETVSFTMIFQDTRTPKLTTEFGVSDWEQHDSHAQATTSRLDTNNFSNADKATHAWMESCYGWSKANVKSTLSAQCFHQLSKTPKAEDAYDGTVSTAIRVRKCYKSNASGGCSGTAWTLIKNTVNWKIDTRRVSKLHIVEYESCDRAGIFGYNEQNNCGVQRNVININDDTKPLITRNDHVGPSIPTGVMCSGDTDEDCEIECNREGSLYQEPGAQCYDARESWLTNARKDEDADVTYTKNGKSFKPMSQIGTKLFDAKKGDANADILGSKGDVYVVHYNCDDGEGQHATEVFRTLTVKDVTAPVITMHGPKTIENSAGAHISSQGTRFEKVSGLDMGYSNGGLGDTASPHVVSCTDTCDPTPFITSELHKGFGCKSKFGDGKLSNFDEYAKGHYSILYTCYDHYDRSLSHFETTHMDSGTHGSKDGRKSLKSTVCRDIDNVDHTHPILQVLGADVMKLEATHEGNYVDDGATCSDQVDGVISQNVEVSGDVVNLSKVGTYTVWYHCKDSAGNAAPPLPRTVVVAHTTCPRCTMNNWKKSITHEASFPYTDQGASCSDGIDGTLPVHVKSGDVSNPCQWANKATVQNCHAGTTGVNTEETGTYVVTYRATNSVGSWNDGPKCRNGAKHYKRTVVVKDSLKPVMEVRYANKVVAISDGTDKSIKHSPATPVNNPATNDAGYSASDVVDSDATVSKPEGYMAEAAQGSSAWLLAAAGAAVAGLALLGMSQRRAAVVSVPV